MPPVTPAKDSRFVRGLQVAFGLMLVVGVGGAVAWAAARYVRTSPRFAVTEIATVGNARRTPEEVATIAGLARDQNIFSVDLERARSRLLADPWISEATLARRLPGTVQVRLTERAAAGLLAMNDGSYLVTRDGAVIKRVEPGDPTDQHVVTGITAEQVAEDREGTARTIRRALDLAAEYEQSPLARRSPLEEVHVEPSGEMSVVIGKSATMLRLGPAPYRRKLEQAVRVVAELDRRGTKAEAIMLDNEIHPERVVVRTR